MPTLKLSIYLSSLFAISLSQAFATHPAHDRDFWRSIVGNHYAIPGQQSADALASELSSMLASPDPELRDDLAYSILATWIYRDQFSTPVLLSLTDEWRANLKKGLAEAGSSSVLNRSFSALCLASMARREAKTPFMGADRYHQLVTEATIYLQSESDLRGYDPTLHWIHATAHTADLLAGLAQSPMLTKEEAAGILQAIDVRLQTARQVYTQGEQDRLAVTLVSIIARKDFDESTFRPWLTHLAEEDRNVWTHTTPESLARFQNHNYLLQSLTVRILQEPDSPLMTHYRQQVVTVLSER